MQDDQTPFTNRKYFVSTQGHTEASAQAWIASHPLRIGGIAHVNHLEAIPARHIRVLSRYHHAHSRISDRLIATDELRIGRVAHINDLQTRIKIGHIREVS